MNEAFITDFDNKEINYFDNFNKENNEEMVKMIINRIEDDVDNLFKVEKLGGGISSALLNSSWWENNFSRSTDINDIYGNDIRVKLVSKVFDPHHDDEEYSIDDNFHKTIDLPFSYMSFSELVDMNIPAHICELYNISCDEDWINLVRRDSKKFVIKCLIGVHSNRGWKKLYDTGWVWILSSDPTSLDMIYSESMKIYFKVLDHYRESLNHLKDNLTNTLIDIVKNPEKYNLLTESFADDFSTAEDNYFDTFNKDDDDERIRFIDNWMAKYTWFSLNTVRYLDAAFIPKNVLPSSYRINSDFSVDIFRPVGEGIDSTDERWTFHVGLLGEDFESQKEEITAINEDLNWLKKLANAPVEQLPFKFNICYVNFNVDCNLLKDLTNCPKIVRGNFSCMEQSGRWSDGTGEHSVLASLNGSPESCESYYCGYNMHLTSLEGMTKNIRFNIDLTQTGVESLEGCPEKILGGFCCNQCKNLKNFIGMPKECEYLLASDDMIGLESAEGIPEDEHIKHTYIDYKHIEQNKSNKLEESFTDDFEKSEDEPTYIDTFNKEDNEYYWNEVLKKLDSEWFNRMIAFKQNHPYDPYAYGGQTIDLGEITKNPWYVIKVTYTNRQNYSAYGGRGGSDSHYVSFKVYKRWYQTERKSATKSEEIYRSRMFRYSAYPGYDGLPSVEDTMEICKNTITQVLKSYYLNILPSATNESFDDDFSENPEGETYFDAFSRSDANYNRMVEWLEKSITFSLPNHIAKAYWKIRYDENTKDYIVDLLVEPKEGYDKHGYKANSWTHYQSMSTKYATFNIKPVDLPEFTHRSHPELHDIIEKEVKELTAKGEDINWQEYYWGRQRFDRITVPNYKFPYNIKFGICEGILYAENIGLTDMTALPREIYGSLCVSGNNFKSFYGCPEKIGGDIFADLNLIESFDGLPSNYTGSLFLAHNKIKTLKGLPIGVDRIEMEDNLLLSLDGFPKQSLRKVDFSYNRIVDLRNCVGNRPNITGSINIEHNFLPKSITLAGYLGKDKPYEKRVKPQDPISKEDKKKLLDELTMQRQRLFGISPVLKESFNDDYLDTDDQNYFDTFSKESSGELRRLITEWINENLTIGNVNTKADKSGRIPKEDINYRINDDNTIDLFEIKDKNIYDSNYYILSGCVPDKNGTKLPDYIQFNTLYNCGITASGLNLDTLKGFPKTIIIDGMFQEFNVRNNKLETFEGCPQYIVKNYPGGNLIARFIFEENEIDYDHSKLENSSKPLKDYKLPFVIHENRTIEYGKKNKSSSSVPNYVTIVTTYSTFELYEKPWFNEEFFTNEAWNLRIKWKYNQIHQKAYNIDDIHYNIYGIPCTDELKEIFDAENKKRIEKWEKDTLNYYKNQLAASKQKHLQEGFDDSIDFDDEKEKDDTYFDTFVKASEGDSENYQNQAIEWIESHFDKLLGTVSPYGENKAEGINSNTKMFEYRTQKVYDGVNLYTKGNLSYNEPGEFVVPGYVHWIEHDGDLEVRANGQRYKSVACYMPTLIGMPKIVTGKFELNICDDCELKNLKGMPEEVNRLQIVLGKLGDNLDAYWGTNYMPKWIKHELVIYDFSKNDTPKLTSMAPFQNTRIGSRDFTKASWAEDSGNTPSYTFSGPGITGLSGLDKIIERENSEVYMIYINGTNITSLEGAFPEKLEAMNIHIEENKNLTSLNGMPKILKSNNGIYLRNNALTSLQGMSPRIMISYFNDDSIYKMLSDKDKKIYTEKTGRTYIELDPTNSRERVPWRKIAKTIIHYDNNNIKGDPFKTVKDVYYDTLPEDEKWKERWYKSPTGKPDKWGWRENCRKEMVLDIIYK